MAEIENGRIAKTKTEARAGVTGHNVRYVLLVGLCLTMVLFTVAYFFAK